MTSVQVRQLRHPKYQLEHLHRIHRDTYSQINTFLESANVKRKKEAPKKSKRATQQFLWIFSFILSSNAWYFLPSHCRNSNRWLTSLDRTEEENQVIGLRPQWAKNSGWKITLRNRGELTSTWTAHLSFHWIHQYQTKQESGSLSETFSFKPS